MKKRTQELIDACKEAGYKHLAICCSNENVPESIEVESSNSPYWMCGSKNISPRPHLVCASPPQRDSEKWPKMWDIIRNLKLNFGGAGYGDCYPVRDVLIADLDVGYYDLRQ